MIERIVIKFDPIFDSISYVTGTFLDLLEKRTMFYDEPIFDIFLCYKYENIMNMKAKRICKHISNYIER